jgi:outer membrane protein assembly factor BamD (BamD/ComL family)
MNTIRRHGAPVRALVLGVFALFVLAGCATTEEKDLATMGKAKIFQKAYEAMDVGDFKGALRYYTSFQQLFPDDLAGNLWASYEIAFLYHKMGDNARSIELFEELILKYKNENNATWPQAQRILAERVVGDIKKAEAAVVEEPPKTN